KALPYSEHMKLRTLFFKLYVFCIIALSAPLFGASSDDNSNPIRLYYELNSDDSYTFFADSNSVIPAYLNLRFTSLTNLASDEKTPFEFVVYAGAKRVHLLGLKPGKGARTEFKYEVTFALGDPLSVKPDDSYL